MKIASHFHQLHCGDTKMFPSRPRDISSPACLAVYCPDACTTSTGYSWWGGPAFLLQVPPRCEVSTTCIPDFILSVSNQGSWTLGESPSLWFSFLFTTTSLLSPDPSVDLLFNSASGFYLYFFQMTWSCWLHWTVTPRLRWHGLKLSVKWQGWTLPPLNPRPWISVDKGWIAPSRPGEEMLPLMEELKYLWIFFARVNTLQLLTTDMTYWPIQLPGSHPQVGSIFDIVTVSWVCPAEFWLSLSLSSDSNDL